jgi:amino-acid N-acetyltransferase
MVNDYAREGKMLPRPLSSLYENIRDFLVAEADGLLMGAGALHVLWDNLAEVRTVVVRAGHMNSGVGRRLVAGLLEDAKALGISRVFTLTYRQAFFEKCGFYVIDKETLPQKVWTDCLNCPKFPNCDEICMAVDSGGNADA